MNNIIKSPIDQIGYNFIPPAYLKNNQDEYHLRNIQNRSGIDYRQLSASEIEKLVRNNNTSDNWNNILVSDAFNPDFVKNCKFFGLIRIGKLEPFCLEYHNLKMPVGLYNSTLISCDFGDNVVIDNVNYLSHFIIGNNVMVVNVNELTTTNVAKFGNGILKEGEPEERRIWMEVCNENAGRKIIPFVGMLPGDAYIWSKFRDDDVIQQKFLAFTEEKFDVRRGYYGKIGDRTVIKNTNIIKDVWIGSDAYIKGANKIKNVTINSTAEASSQIGEGCELVNGILGVGSKVFYGAKAVRFIMAGHSQLKYGARLINSYLGHNSTISCCEVLNSLIFPFHEQHHNNSFLCAATLGGQTNMAAGATIGSNHNSRGADGELVAGRGFWPGLCVSLKHNSKFASFIILSKGDYPSELNIPLPFSLVSDDVHLNRLVVIPGYFFSYNMYALSRNEWKYTARDLRIEKTQHIETSYLAPDSINDIFKAIELLKLFTGKAYFKHIEENQLKSKEEYTAKGESLLQNNDPIVNDLEILAEGFENSNRKTVLLKVQRAFNEYQRMVRFYATKHIIQFMLASPYTLEQLIANLPFDASRNMWISLGGQLIPEKTFNQFRTDIHQGKVKGWDDVHQFYTDQGIQYQKNIFEHAFASLVELDQLNPSTFTIEYLQNLLHVGVETMDWITNGIKLSRQKDYENEFRKMVYDTEAEMNKVMGSFEDNSFIKMKQKEADDFRALVEMLLSGKL
jgi:hypothetical protein